MNDIYTDALKLDEAKSIFQIINDLLNSIKYAENNEEIREKLQEKLKEYLTEKNDREIAEYVDSVMDSISTNERKLSELNVAKKKGINREAWFAETMEQAVSHQSTEQTLAYYNIISETIQKSNENMYNAVITNSGSVNMLKNLDGFIAEQHHVNTFNQNAAIKGSSYRAEIIGHTGESYTKNGVDVVIKDGTGKTVRRYQSKYCKDAVSTEAAFRHGDYRGQRSLVPSDQLDEIQANGRINAVDTIEYDGIKSEPLSKYEAKSMQEKIQQGEILHSDWNNYKLKELAVGVGKQATNAALMGAVITTGMTIAEKTISGEELTADEVIETALVSGADSGVKAAVSGTLIIAAEKGILSALPKGTPASVISSIAFIAVENAKIAMKVASGELTVTDGLSRMTDVTLAAVTGMSVSFIASAEIGVAVGLIFGPVAGVVTGFVAGTIGYIAGSKIGQDISKGVKAVGNAALSFVKTVGKGIIDTGKAVVNTIGNAVNAVGSFVSNVVSSVGSFFGF